MPEPIDIVIRPTMNPDEPRWPMLWRPSTHWQVTVGDFDEWSSAGEHTGWGSVDSVIRNSPIHTAKNHVRDAVNEAVDLPWLS
jgi:hypothetical protein